MALGRLVCAGSALLAALALVEWWRHRDPSRAYLAAALGLLSAVALAGQLLEIEPGDHLAFQAIRAVCFLGSGYALLGFRGCFVRLSRRARAVSTTLLLIAGVAAAASIASAGTGTSLQWLAVALVVGVWSGCVVEPVYRFWTASRGRPPVQRRRLRALVAGYLLVVAALLLGLAAGAFGRLSADPPSPLALTALPLANLAAIVLIYLSMAPPPWLRHAWRRDDEDALEAATRRLLQFSSDRADLAQDAVEAAVRLFGAESAVVADQDGELVATVGLDPAAARTLAVDAARICHDAHGALLLGRPANRLVVPIWTEDGTWSMAFVAGPFTPLFGSDEVRLVESFSGYIADSLDRARLVEDLSRQTAANESLLQAISDMGEGVHINVHGRLVYANPAFCDITGYTVDELMAMESMAVLLPEELRPGHRERYRQRLAGDDVAYHYETQMVVKGGSRVDIEVVVKTLGDLAGGRMMTIIRDIGERKATERAVADLVRVDPLTRVLNRRGWDEAMAEGLSRARRTGESVSVAVMDLDDFKTFNDDWGHQKGDLRLQSVAEAWKQGLRAVDVIARYGGDEFTLLLPGSELEGAREVAMRLRALTPEQKVSIGLACWRPGESAAELVGRADAALFRAKREGSSSIVVARSSSDDPFTSWTKRLEELVSERGLAAVYQPIVNLNDGTAIGYEALARPVGAAASDSVEDLFVAAHRLGLGRDLDWLGRRAAVEGAGALPDDAFLFINVGVAALLDPLHGVDQMLLLLRWAGRSPSEIVLEISEREVITDLERLSRVLADYRAEGFRFALDDVGDGHCTLEVLSAASAEYIKIARGLCGRWQEPGPGSAIHAVTTFAAHTGARVVAEGIDSGEMVETMLGLGIELGQGYHLGRPERLAPAEGRQPSAAAG